MTLKKILASFLKIGIIGFGGGSALIPVIEHELVTKNKAVTPDDYIKHTVVANITPGALPAKLGATCGYSLAGGAGALAGAYCVLLPGVFFTVLVIALFSILGEGAVTYLSCASVGISVFIVYLLIHYVVKTMLAGALKTNITICILALLATFGKELREIISYCLGLEEHALGTPVFDISMINLMILSFYLIIFMQLVKRRGTKVFGVVLAVAYAVSCGKLAAGWAIAVPLRTILIVLFILTIVIAAIRLPRREGGGTIRMQKGIMLSIALFVLIPAVFTGVSMAFSLIPGDSAAFLGNLLLSTVTSFGGGEAYVAVADSVFVQGGYVGSDVFYGQIVPVANALPGPILIKIAAAIGFIHGQTGGQMLGGLLLAAASALASAGACCVIALVVLNFYEILKDSVIIQSLKKYILSVICGTLISTSMAMFYEAIKVTGSRGFSPTWTLLVLTAGVAATWWVRHKWRLHDLLLLFIVIVISIAFLIPFGTIN